MKDYPFRREVRSIAVEERTAIRNGNTRLTIFRRQQIISIWYAVERGVSLKAIAEYWDICPGTVKRRVRAAMFDESEKIRLAEYNERQVQTYAEMEMAITEYNKQFNRRIGDWLN